MVYDNPSSYYDSYYYANCCGRPYEHNEIWLSFFGSIADRIIQDIQPRTVFDAGCAMGFLVECLRQRGVEAWGVDISEYAIQNVQPDIRPYCWVGSVMDPFPQRYDLIVCIETLEHLMPQDAQKAVQNLCLHTDDILFSSTPYDFEEATHFNVQSPDYWAELFARFDFIHDLDSDASFITPWAMRFRKSRLPVSRVVSTYEQNLWRLTEENRSQREINLEQRAELIAKESQIQSLIAQVAEMDQANQAGNLQIQEQARALEDNKRVIQAKDELLQTTQQSLKDNLVRSVPDNQSALVSRWRIIPEGSKRERWVLSIIRGVELWRREGFTAFRYRLNEKFTAHKKARDGASTTQKNYQRVRRIGARQAAEAMFWRLRTAAGKRYILLQDKLGWYTYADWIKENEASPSSPSSENQPEVRFSLLLPIIRTDLPQIANTLKSLFAQTYSNWEVYLLYEAADFQYINALLANFPKNDAHIQQVKLEPGQTQADMIRIASKLAHGDWIGALFCGDGLSPTGLDTIAGYLAGQPRADVVYMDEDRLTEDGKTRHSPFFKPDWSPDLLLSTNYLVHALFRMDLFRSAAVDCLDLEDVVYRCMEGARQVVHIPKVLYHLQQEEANAWRSARPRSDHLAAHLQRIGLSDATVNISPNGAVRVSWPFEEKPVSIIIPTQDRVKYLRRCLDSIINLTRYPDFEILLIENNSRQAETLAYYKQLQGESQIRIIEHHGAFNYSRVNNLGARHARGDWLLFLNNDVEIIDSDWLTELARWVSRPEVGVVGARLLYPDGAVQHAGIVIGMEGHASHVFGGARQDVCGPFGCVDWYRDYSAVTGACMMIRKEVFEQIDGFDENYQLVFSDVEICLRVIEQGYRVVYNPFTRLIHYEGKTRSNHMPRNDIRLGYERLKSIVADGDPFYNPLLSHSIRRPTLSRAYEETPTMRLENIRMYY